MHLKNPLLFGLMAILLLGGTITPALSQSSPESGIVINEVELNPTGSDAGYGSGGSGINSKTTDGLSGANEYVELYNPTTESIDISGWSLVPSATWKSLIIPDGTIIDSNSFLAFTYVNFWFKDFGETITLVDDMGNVIDQTPLLKDNDDDATSWQRSTDGYDTDSITDWELKRMTPKSTNGKITQLEEISFTISANTDKETYSFGETVTLTGNVSEYLYTNLSTPEIIKISISGPSYFKNLAVFPDRDLNFVTSLNLQEVLGFKIGTYDVKISYGENTIQTQFFISEIETSSPQSSESETLRLFTDKESYIPGETVNLFADTNSSIDLGGLEYNVKNPNGEIIFEGTIFPNERFSTVFQAGSGQIYPFSVKLFMETVNPVYGVYEVTGVYKSQDVTSRSSNQIIADTSFIVAEDIKENIPISLSTDKTLYSIGETIKVNGRSNDVWVETMQVEVVQTGVLTASEIRDEKKQQYEPFRLIDSVRLNGDGTFEFEFELFETTKGQEDFTHVLGDYRIEVSSYHGEGVVYFKIVEDPESFTEIRTPLGLTIDKSKAVLGSSLTFSGKILDYVYNPTRSINQYVEFTFHDPNGKLLMYEDDKKFQSNDYGASPNERVTITAIPDSLGLYSVDLVLTPIQFEYGTYTATVSHPYTDEYEKIDFEVISAQSEIIEVTEIEEPITVNLCKSNSAEVDDILKDLRSIGKGEIPPSMDSVDCSENISFFVGDKLVVTGKVALKNPTSLDQSSTKTSGQTQDGHSYSTNYAQSIMNYVDVSIPYPQSLIVTKSAAWKTIPDDDENYTGGGGSGGGGVMHGGEDGKGSQAGTGRGEDKNLNEKSNRHTGYDGQKILQKQKILLTDMKYKAYPDKEGNFATVFELRAGVFNSGTYAVKADYYGYKAETSVVVTDNSLKGGLSPKISVSLDKDEYLPGEMVRINGIIENAYYYDNISAKIDTPDVSKINCFEGQQCGLGNTVKKLRIQETVEGPAFFWNYKLPNTDTSLGKYVLTIDTHFGKMEKEFFVVSENDIIGKVPESESQSQTNKIIEKFNRIPDNKISIPLGEKSSEDSKLIPRVLQGSLFTSARGEESNVNLKITTSNGQCVIGADSDCLVTESTRKPGAIYSIVSIDDINYKIRYSGNDVRLEKFSIVPEESGSKIDIDNWNVEIIKDEQPSRFYYKVSYMALE